MMERSAIYFKLDLLAQSRPKVFQTAKLKLLDSTFAAIQIDGDFANTFLLRKTEEDYFALILGQRFNCVEQSRATLSLFEIRIDGRTRRRYLCFTQLA